MESVNQDTNSNNGLASLNYGLLEIYKSNYQQLTPLMCENNHLKLNDESFPLDNFRLNQLSTMVYELPAKEFFNIVKIISEVENNINYEDYYLFTISQIIEKNNLSEEEVNNINKFTNTYLELKKYEDYLAGIATITLSKYRQIVNHVLYLSNPDNLTMAQKIITEKILSANEELGGRGNSITRTLKNPDIPSMVSDEEQYFSKAGFASIILILYSIINAAVILAIHLIK